MAATGYTPISIYYSSTTTNVPTAGNLVAGELAINTADGKLFYKDSSGVVQVIGTKGGVGSSTTTQVLYNSSGLVVGSSNMTFDGTKLTLANDASISGLTVGKGVGSDANTTVVGSLALSNGPNTGTSNTAIGFAVMYANTSGSNGVGVGGGALRFNTTGGSNTALGFDALYNNTTASNNTAVGYQAGYSANSGNGVCAVGYQAMYSTTSGDATAMGYQAALSLTSASQVVAIGYQALKSSTTANYNTALGSQAGYSSTTAQYNTLVGAQAGYNLTTGSRNTFVGNWNSGNQGCGRLVTTGSANTIIGSFDGNSVGLDIRTASNYIVLSDGDGNPRAYNNATNWYQGNNSTLWAITSDARIKKNVVSLESGLNVISALRPVEFDYIANNKHDIGFIAQEYQTVLPEQVNEKDDGMLSLTPNLVPYLVKAIQELNAKVTALESQLGAK